jgi:Zn finger protein HypA/HybF involved in hydrogenase expression
MQLVENLVSCEKCSKRVNVKEMKFDLSGTELICPECYEKQKKTSTQRFERKELGPSLATERKKERSLNLESYIYYKCSSCSYSFSRNSEFKFKNCPFCGKHTVEAVQKNTAQKIIEDSNKDTDLGIEFL